VGLGPLCVVATAAADCPLFCIRLRCSWGYRSRHSPGAESRAAVCIELQHEQAHHRRIHPHPKA
jgi:hypothetical protein